MMILGFEIGFWYSLLIFIISMIVFLLTMWLFARNPKNYFKTKRNVNLPSVILSNFPPQLPANFDDKTFISLPSHLSNMSAILMVYIFPYNLWANVINDIIMLITNVNDYYFLKSNKADALKMKGQLYMELYAFLNDFKICLKQEDINKCSSIIWEMREKIASDHMKVRNLLSSP